MLLYLDLGDFMTKCVAIRDGRSRRLRFPSVVAKRLVSEEDDDADHGDLLLAEPRAMPRLSDFDPQRYPRARSYPRQHAHLKEIEPVRGARFAGQLAVALGADRELLGNAPSDANVDALVRKALLLVAAENDEAELVFIVDIGSKAEAIERWAARSPAVMQFVRHRPKTKATRVRIRLRSSVVEAASCAAAFLPKAEAGGVLLVDVGYLRTKLAFLSPEGCELQREIEGLGVIDCVRTVLRDEQEHGLFEDEYAIAHALERSLETIEVAGRRFEIAASVERARATLEQELTRAVERSLREVYERRGRVCKAIAVVGGGSAIVAKGLRGRLQDSNLGVDLLQASSDPFCLIEGARKLDRA